MPPKRPLDGKASTSTALAGASTDEADSAPLPLNDLLKRLTASSVLSVREAIPVAGRLVKANLNTPAALASISEPVLEEVAGLQSQELRKKILVALGSATPRKKPRYSTTTSLAREYGNAPPPEAKNGKGRKGAQAIDYVFNEVLDEEQLRNRHTLVNRAPVMTAWCVVVLERLGFKRREALSLAHCYVNTTSTSRGISLGIIPASQREKAVERSSANQPHFELMGLKIPVMQMQDGEWRGINAGEVIGPDKAFNYLRNAMHQNLPLVMGALTLLADAWCEEGRGGEEDEAKGEADPAAAAVQPGSEEGSASLAVKSEAEGDGEAIRADTDEVKPPAELDVKPDPVKVEADDEPNEQPSPVDVLHARAYSLYADFRPATSGEWGRKAKLYLGKILALRPGREGEWEESAERGGEEGE